MFSSNTTQVSDGGYQISRSLRFNSADSAYLNRTPASAGNRKTWTYSAWIKRSTLGTNQWLFGARGGASPYFLIGYNQGTDNNIIRIVGDTISPTDLRTSQVFRDVGAWFHLVVAVDTSQATASNRIKIYVNGTQVTAFSQSDYPAQNNDTNVNATVIHNISGQNTYGEYFDGYMTEVNFIDGQALTPSSFGETNAQTGVWQPKAYSGSYGTNGFYLNFSDNSNTTAATLGKDYSGNGNNWTPTGFLVSAGVNNDSLVDSPTSYGVDTGAGGNVGGNYSTMNPLAKGSSQTFANGNLQTSASSSWGIAPATFGMSSGKWYCEVTQTAGGSYNRVGLTTQSAERNNYIGIDAYGWAYLNDTGNKGTNGATTAYGASWTTNDTVGIAFDADTGSLTFYKNGTSQGVAYTGLTSGPYFFTFASYDVTLQVNFGQRPFAYTAPSGFKALCTQNLPTPTIGATTATQAGKYFNPVLYTGNAPSSQSISGVGFQPDFVWVKNRSGAYYHGLFDAVRGVNNVLVSNTTAAEDAALTQQLNSFNSDGFTVGTNSDGGNYTNVSGYTYVAWNWKANGSGSTNTAGSITSTVSANTTSGFSIVTYTGTGSAGATVGHGLDAVPSMIIFKRRNATSDWQVYHTSLGNAASVYLNLTNSSASSPGMLNSTTPTSTLITLGTSTDTNPSTGTMVAYCFAPIAGYSAFGSYVGNNSADGPFVYLGFKPKFVLIKDTGTVGNWWIGDGTRSTYNVVAASLLPNLSNAESSAYNECDFLSNGFKWRATDANSFPNNVNGNTYIYMAFAENPFKFSLAR